MRKSKIKEVIKRSFLYDLMTPVLELTGMKKGISKKQIKRLIGKNPLVLEIGCNDGEDSAEFLQTIKDIMLYCFEPDPRAIKKFKERVKDKRCELFEIALSDKNGKVTFHLSGGQPPSQKDEKDWDKSSSIKKPAKHLEICPWCNFDRKINVKTERLDNWVDKNKIERIDFIWADVQGAERELILGGLKTLNNKTRYFYTEFNNEELYEGQPTLNEILKMLPNFRIIKRYKNNVLLKNTKFKNKLQ